MQTFDELNSLQGSDSRNMIEGIGGAASSRFEITKKSGSGAGREISRVSDIYLNKSLRELNKHHLGNKTVGTKPFRPMMKQFEDDPGEINANTVMDGVRYGAGQGRDVSLHMAEQVDQIQRNYINHS